MMVAWYALPLSLRYSATRVAWPTQIGSTPLAAGSSVPAWPTRLCLSSLRTFATTSCEVMPVGLLMLSMPSMRYSLFHPVCYPGRPQGSPLQYHEVGWRSACIVGATLAVALEFSNLRHFFFQFLHHIGRCLHNRHMEGG